MSQPLSGRDGAPPPPGTPPPGTPQPFGIPQQGARPLPDDPTAALPQVGGRGVAPASPWATPAGYPPPAGHGQPGYPVANSYPNPAAPQPFGGPVSGVPASGVPASGVPFAGGPQPYPGASFPGAPLGPPMSAPPGPGLPYGAPPPSGAGRRRTVLVLALVVGLLVPVSVVLTGLFVTKSNELNRTERELTGQIAERDRKITANGQEIDQLKRNLQAANDKIAAVEQDLTGTKNDRDEQARQKAVIANCLDLFGKAMTASSQSAFDKAIKEAEKVCDEADGYL